MILDNGYIVENDVLRFEVSMDDLGLMHVIQCAANLIDYVLSHLFGYSPLCLQERVELT